MLYANITIKNPFITKDLFRSILAKSGTISRNKAWEVEALHNACTLFKIELNIDWRGRDHAGPYLCVGLFGYEVGFKLYDTRHWDYKKNKWEVHE